MKTIAQIHNPDGSCAIGHLWWLENHGNLACQLAGYFLNTEAMKMCLSEEESPAYSPRRIANLACDLAEAMYAEMDARDWILKLPEDVEGQHGFTHAARSHT